MPIIKHIQQHKLLLDTHVWIWVASGDPILAPVFRETVDRERTQERILISAISIWEIGMLVEKKRLELEMDCLDWVERFLSQPGVSLCALSPRIAIQSTRLPGEIHSDPADRILVASAHEEGAVLVTCDEKLLEYGKGRFVNVYDPRKRGIKHK